MDAIRSRRPKGSHRRGATPAGRTLRLLCTVLAVLVPAGRAAAVSFQGERDLGRRFDLVARQRLPMVNDPEVIAYVSEIGTKLAGGLEDSYFDYQFAVVRDPNVNAFAVPGGYVYVNAGLLMHAKNDDEVAGVLGHEIAHVHAHHIVRQQEATQLLNYATLLGMLVGIVQPAVGGLAAAANAAVTLQYRREFEQEADFLGARYLQRAGYDPRAMLDFFKKLADQSGVAPALVPPYLQSHPMTDERMNHLEAVLKTQQWAGHERPVPSFKLQRVQALARVRTQPPEEVVKAYRGAAEQDPGNTTAQYLYGLVSLETGQLEAAGPALELARAGGLEAADRELGRLALRQRDLGTARERLERYLAAEPGDAGARVELAKTLEALGEPSRAQAEYRRALETAPRLEAAHYGYGLLAGRAGAEGEGFYHLAVAARLSGDYEKALNQFVRAKPLLPTGDARADDARRSIVELSEFLRAPMRD